MNESINRTMQDAMRLMQSGDLRAATQAIQRGLGQADNPPPAAPQNGPATAEPWLEGEFRVLPPGDCCPESATTDARQSQQTQRPSSPQGTFRAHRFECATGSLSYKLFIPGGRDTIGLPLIVMLHGCTQSPDDFARGTRMNALAQQHGYVVAYPAQSPKQNTNRCWNWFRAGDQQRGQGEPALLAALTHRIVAANQLDARRVYVAGLSAGGAMAAVLGGAYPDVYAAVGIHSGLPVGAARDVPSAFAAMKRQAGAVTATVHARVQPVPAIVFHGDRDTTVDACNGAAVVEQFAAAASTAPGDSPSLRSTIERGTAAGGRTFTRTLFRDAQANIIVEQWLVHGGGHAWFGGDRSGSYTDAAGPDASAEMIRFFRNCSRPSDG